MRDIGQKWTINSFSDRWQHFVLVCPGEVRVLTVPGARVNQIKSRLESNHSSSEHSTLDRQDSAQLNTSNTQYQAEMGEIAARDQSLYYDWKTRARDTI